LSSQAAGHFLAVNNYCPAVLNASKYRTLKPYLVDANGSLYTFDIYAGYSNGGQGDYMQIMSGISSSEAQAVQQYRISSSPFALPLQNGGSYAFKFYDSNCQQIFATNYSIWANQITITLPTNQSQPVITLPNITTSCVLLNVTNTTENIKCTGTDTNDKVTAWNVTHFYVSGMAGWMPSQSHDINSSSFEYIFTNISSQNASRVVVSAYGPGFLISQPYDFNQASITQGLSLTARAFLTFLFLLVGLGISVGAEQGGAVSEEHLLSVTIMIMAVMLAFSYLLGVSTYLPMWAIVILLLLLIYVGLMVHRAESRGGF
jgi:hypothetical protein